MTAGEDHAELVVLYLLFGKEMVEGGLGGEFGSKQMHDRGYIFPLMIFPADDSEGFVLCHPEEPGRGVVGYAFVFPVGHGFYEGVLYDILGQVEVLYSKDPGQDGYQFPGFVPEQVIDQPGNIVFFRHLGGVRFKR